MLWPLWREEFLRRALVLVRTNACPVGGVANSLLLHAQPVQHVMLVRGPSRGVVARDEIRTANPVGIMSGRARPPGGARIGARELLAQAVCLLRAVVPPPGRFCSRNSRGCSHGAINCARRGHHFVSC